MGKIIKIKTIKQNNGSSWTAYTVEDEFVNIKFKNNRLTVIVDDIKVFDKDLSVNQIIKRNFDKNSMDYEEMKRQLWDVLMLPSKLWL